MADRVELLGFVSADELVALYAGCRAAYYAPLNEDYGYVTVEAFLSRKPVVTTTDAGGPLEFVTDGRDGLRRGARRRRRSPHAIDALWALAGGAPARDGRGRATRGVEDITWDA